MRQPNPAFNPLQITSINGGQDGEGAFRKKVSYKAQKIGQDYQQGPEKGGIEKFKIWNKGQWGVFL